jgi:hypothetical protein
MGELPHLSHLSCTFSMEKQSMGKQIEKQSCAFFLVAMFKILVKTWRNLRASDQYQRLFKYTWQTN